MCVDIFSRGREGREYGYRGGRRRGGRLGAEEDGAKVNEQSRFSKKMCWNLSTNNLLLNFETRVFFKGYLMQA